MLLALYHRRPISACYSSYIPDEAVEVFRMTVEGIDRDALRRLAENGFTTLVVNQRALGIPIRDFEARLSASEAKGRAFIRRANASAIFFAISVSSVAVLAAPTRLAEPTEWQARPGIQDYFIEIWDLQSQDLCLNYLKQHTEGNM